MNVAEKNIWGKCLIRNNSRVISQVNFVYNDL
jgi:hypothetical protein